MENNFEKRYRKGDTPWDHGIPDINLIELLEKREIPKCKALDIGCGTGDNSIWLANQGFTVMGCDFSPTAIEKAREKVSGKNLKCEFVVADILHDRISGAPFGFIFDRGCLHSVGSHENRRLFVKNAAAHLEEGGIWLTLTGNADEPPREVGPPQLTAEELIASVELDFEILALTSGHFGSKQENPAWAWVCLMRKR